MKAKEKRIRRQRRQVRHKAKAAVWRLCEDIARASGVDPFDVLIAPIGENPSVDDAVRAWMGTLGLQHDQCRVCAADGIKETRR